MGRGKAHYIEVTSDNKEDEGYGHLQNIEADTIENAEDEDVVTALQQMRR